MHLLFTSFRLLLLDILNEIVGTTMDIVSNFIEIIFVLVQLTYFGFTLVLEINETQEINEKIVYYPQYPPS